MTDFRGGNPDQMDELANRLWTAGDGGIYGDLVGLFDRARALGASAEVWPVSPLFGWLMDTSGDLRVRAEGLRGDQDRNTTTPDYSLLDALADVPGRQDTRPTPEEILHSYHLPPNPGGMVMFPPAPWGWMVEQKRVTSAEAGLLDELGALGIVDLADLADSAYGTAEERFPGQGREDGHNDAFRHAYWNALMVREYGEDWAREYATAHEGVAGNMTDREAMDLFNNEVGRQIAVENPFASDEELADLIEQAIRDGEMVVIPPGGGIAYSDQIAPGETGEASIPPAEATDTDGAESDSTGDSGSGDRNDDYEYGQER
jgi:hypothetical protein